MTENQPDLLVFGRKLRSLRKAKGLTLQELGARVGRPAPYLSQLETGKREPRLLLTDALAQALGVTTAELLDGTVDDRRAQLEIAVERAQAEPLYRTLGLAHLQPTARVPDVALEHVVSLYRQLADRVERAAVSQEGARRSNAELRVDMRSRDNHFTEIEAAAAASLSTVGWQGAGAVAERTIIDLAASFGFRIRRVPDLPAQTRAVTDLRHGIIFIPQRNAAPTRTARSVIVQTLGRFALGHAEPVDFSDYLRQQVEANYFAGAVLVPASAAVPFLAGAKARHDLSVEDLKEVFYVSYEMAAHRFTNLATEHLGLAVHFLRADEDGVISKAYENDGLPFPTDSFGAIEGQRACRHWGTRAAFEAADAFDIHYQYTETPAGTYWSATHIEADEPPHHAITVGVRARDARFFRGDDTTQRHTSRCPDPQCCRQPSTDRSARWAGMVYPAPRQHTPVLTAYPVEAFPGVDMTSVLEFLERQATP
ncbi:MAG TPA: helix-turn-helix domain-containing protein [Acidimicrobiia bacterium]|nr:helix-turn-helix domain-containing protein [Acidimicrobiia bacterium]